MLNSSIRRVNAGQGESFQHKMGLSLSGNERKRTAARFHARDERACHTSGFGGFGGVLKGSDFQQYLFGRIVYIVRRVAQVIELAYNAVIPVLRDDFPVADKFAVAKCPLQCKIDHEASVAVTEP